jgi:hypothetical protein
MTMPIEKVEIGFDLTFSGAGNFFTLDDAIRGELDGSYPLAGLQYIDVTSRVRNFAIGRGRSSLFSQFPAGQASIEFNNHDRAFDPLYTASPYYGNILPRREIRVTSNGIIQFTGWIDDWDLTYSVSGDSIVVATAYDATSIFSGNTLSAGTPTAQLTGARVEAILNDINWSPEQRSIDIGHATVGDQAIEADQNALLYLQKIAAAEPGLLFVSKDGSITFEDRHTTATSDSLVVLGGTGIPVSDIQVVYGSENLYNEIVLGREGGGTATAQDLASIENYGLRNYTETGILLSSDEQILDLSVVYAQRYSTPEYRFESVEIGLHKLNESQQASILGLDMGSICKVIFTPNNIGDPIEQFLQVIRIKHSVLPQTHFIEIGFQALDYAALVLDDPEFGKLDTYSLSW